MNTGPFKLPIDYLDKKQKISDTIITDLELDQSNNNLYNYTFTPSNIYGKSILKKWREYYTDDVDYLNDMQSLIGNFKPCDYVYDNKYDYTKFNDIYNEIEKETGFKEKYHYIELEQCEFLNTYPNFLLFMSGYNLLSPVLSLLLPVILLIIPFFMIRVQNIKISLSSYIETLKKVIKHHAIGKLFTDYGSVSWEKKMYMLFSAGFYVFQIIQNVLTCRSFHNNLYKITNYLYETRNYIDYTVNNIDNLLQHTNPLASFSKFNGDLTIYKNQLSNITTICMILHLLTGTFPSFLRLVPY